MHQLSGWLHSVDLAGEDAGCGYTWSAVVRPVGCTAKFSETANGREMNIQFTGNSLVDIPAVTMPIARSLKLATSVALCCVIKVHLLEWPLIVTSLRHSCAIIILSNQHLDTVRWMDYLGSLTQIYNIYNI